MNRSTRLYALLLLVALAIGAAALVLAQGSSTDGNVAARIGKQAITLEEIDARASAQNTQAYQQLYEARNAALSQMIVDKLLTLEATSRSISIEDLTRIEVGEKVVPATDAEVEAFYNQNVARMGGQSLDEVRGLIRERLTEQKQVPLRTALIASLKTKYDVKVILDPPRIQVNVAQNDPTKGPAGAPIQLVLFSEFQ